MEFITENLSAIAVCAVLIGIVGLVVRKLIRDKRAGKSGCGCNCGSCALSDKCHKK